MNIFKSLKEFINLLIKKKFDQHFPSIIKEIEDIITIEINIKIKDSVFDFF
jgi:hypothetical protein